MSGPPLSPENQILLKLLDDGQWHAYDEIIAKLEAQIPPGKAVRRYEQRAQWQEKQKGPRKGPPLSEDEMIASGRRTLANNAVNSLKKGYIDVEGEGQDRKIRKRPPVMCDVCAGKAQPVASPPDPQAAGLAEMLKAEARAVEKMESLEGGREFVAGIEYAAGLANTVQPGPDAPAPDVAFMSETQLRAIIAEEIDSALRRFRDHLDTKFTDMEDVARVAALRALARMPYQGSWFQR